MPKKFLATKQTAKITQKAQKMNYGRHPFVGILSLICMLKRVTLSQSWQFFDWILRNKLVSSTWLIIIVCRVSCSRCSRRIRSVTVKHVVSSLPESAKLIIDDMDNEENVKALLMSLKKEADALRKGEITPDLVAEIAILQSDTDGITSTFKQGWI